MATLPSYLADRLVRTASGCLVWTGHITKDGYGLLCRDGERRPVHVVVYELLHGSVPAGHDVGHVCHDLDKTCRGGDTCPHRACADGEHLAAQTRSENARGGRHQDLMRERWLAAETCVAGHRWDDGNAYIRPDNGRRGCRACRREARRRCDARRRAA